MSKLPFASVLWLTATACGLLLSAPAAHAGTERITLADGQATVYQSGSSDVIPVTATLTNGQPDYIEMTYTATDANGDPVGVSPPSAVHYLTKGQSATDNVVVSQGALPVTFVAEAQGEYGGDVEFVTQVLNSIGSSGSSPAGSFGTISAPTLLTSTDCTVPVTGVLSYTGTVPTGGVVSSKVTLTYGATFGPTTSPTSLLTKPVHKTMHFTVGATTNPSNNVLVHLAGNNNVNFTVTPITGAAPLNYTINTTTAQAAQMMPFDVPVTVSAPKQSPTQGTGVLQLTAGPSSLVVLPSQQYGATVAFTPSASGKVTIYYMAQMLDATTAHNPTMTFYPCVPNRRHYPASAGVAIQDTIKIDLSGVASGTWVRFTAIAVDGEGKPSQPGTVDFQLP